MKDKTTGKYKIVFKPDLTILKERIEELEDCLNNQIKINQKLTKKTETIDTLKRMNDINTFQCADGELYLRGTDEVGKDFLLCFDAYNFLNWIDEEQIKYIKEQLIKHIERRF